MTDAKCAVYLCFQTRFTSENGAMLDAVKLVRGLTGSIVYEANATRRDLRGDWSTFALSSRSLESAWRRSISRVILEVVGAPIHYKCELQQTVVCIPRKRSTYRWLWELMTQRGIAICFKQWSSSKNSIVTNHDYTP
ncbi:uncharacterized protein PHALS_00042 [Plasmopara halstedii]|uniref:Uncharacterized protein n=1 Tax=Plasmopara halstedii TaxID=4781 RepID=A0A0P1A5R2_PLAHL|nr:uncharacterized protein PHALS_00042 [Plasmopara halstedii]CEG35705.1 hypothetical protein PHALS_00042 [Plasmopara halstedii]|eukprot:XP_024572074.1 hypothetical protein PHALS_00042 [Plasmopara halstedii]